MFCCKHTPRDFFSEKNQSRIIVKEKLILWSFFSISNHFLWSLCSLALPLRGAGNPQRSRRGQNEFKSGVKYVNLCVCVQEFSEPSLSMPCAPFGAAGSTPCCLPRPCRAGGSSWGSSSGRRQAAGECKAGRISSSAWDLWLATVPGCDTDQPELQRGKM